MIGRCLFVYYWPLLGGIVGIERGSGDRPAGFRTHILVCAGAALFMLVSMYGYDDYPMHGKNSRAIVILPVLLHR